MFVLAHPLRRLLLVAFIVAALALATDLWLGQAVAGAQETVSGDPVATATVITLSPLLVSFLTGTLTPLLAGLALRPWASSTVKAIVGLVCAILGAVVAWLIDHQGGFQIADFAMYALFVFVAHVATYYGAWKPLGPTDGAPTMAIPVGFGGSAPSV